MLDLAEAPCLFEVLKPEEERLELPDCVVFFGAGTDAESCTVQRLRVLDDGVAATVERVRDLVRARGRAGATWSLLLPPHDQSTVHRLLDAGLRPSTPASAIVMALDEAPAPGPADVHARAVETVDDYKLHVTISYEVWGRMDRLSEALARIDRHGEQDLADRSFVRYIACVGGQAVGIGTATFTPRGAMLHSGSTLEAFRRRGVYSALVAHRWDEAVRRGTPSLVTRAGAMSRPVLRARGFREIGEVRFLVDELAAASARAP